MTFSVFQKEKRLYGFAAQAVFLFSKGKPKEFNNLNLQRLLPTPEVYTE